MMLSWMNGARLEQAHLGQHRHHRARAGAARRSIDFRVGEDRHVAQVGVGRGRRPGEDRAVDALEQRLVRGARPSRRFDFARDRHPRAAQFGETLAASIGIPAASLSTIA